MRSPQWGTVRGRPIWFDIDHSIPFSMLSANVAGQIGAPFRRLPLPQLIPAISPFHLPKGDKVSVMARIEMPVQLAAGTIFVQFLVVTGVDNVAMIGLHENRFEYDHRDQ